MKKIMTCGAVSLLLSGLIGCEVTTQPKKERPIVTTPVVDRTPPAVPVEVKPAPAPVPVANLTTYLDENHPVNGPVRVHLNELFQMNKDSLLSANAQKTAYMLAAFGAANAVQTEDPKVYAALLQVLYDRAKEHTIHEWAEGDVHMFELFFLAKLGMNAYEEGNKDLRNVEYHYYQICYTVTAITMATILNQDFDLERAYQKIDEHLTQI